MHSAHVVLIKGPSLNSFTRLSLPLSLSLSLSIYIYLPFERSEFPKTFFIFAPCVSREICGFEGNSLEGSSTRKRSVGYLPVLEYRYRFKRFPPDVNS